MRRTAIPVTFYLPDAATIMNAERMDPERDWQQFGNGVQCWIVQTYIKLKRANFPIVMSHNVPRNGIVVVHADHMHSLLNSKIKSHALIVCVRADREENLYADIEVVQNQALADENRAFFVPHWPQPGLIKRNEARGFDVNTIAYKGADLGVCRS